MKIGNIHINNLRNDAHFQFHTEFRDLVTVHGSAALKIKPQFDAYLPLYEKMDEALKKIVKSEFTAKMQDMDKARDNVYIGLSETNKAALRRFSPEVREAAARLKIVFDTYGNVARKSLDEETSAIYNILQELQGKYAADAATVGIGQWVAELDACNKAFEKLVKERFDEAAARTSVVLKDARAEADAAYHSIVERVNALAVIEGVASYEAFIRTLNVVIAKYALKLHHHHHHHAEPARPEETQNGN